MTKEEATMVAFEIVAYSGDARSKLLMAVEKAKAGDLVTADRLVAEANECLVDAHKAQTDLLQQEARIIFKYFYVTCICTKYLWFLLV